MRGDPLLQVDDLHLSCGGIKALGGVSLMVRAGEASGQCPGHRFVGMFSGMPMGAFVPDCSALALPWPS